MKNMKKILAVGALLTLGTMAMGVKDADGRGAQADFGVTLGVIAPIAIESVVDVDFGQLTTMEVETGGQIGEGGTFTVTGDSLKSVEFSINGGESDRSLKTTNNDMIGYDLDIIAGSGDSGTSLLNGYQEFNGTLDARLLLTLKNSNTNVVAGTYTDTVQVHVDYN